MINDKVLIIAEAGVNHNGSFTIAKKLVDVAKLAGADIVKFQTGVPELIMTDSAPKALYQSRETGSVDSQLDMVKKIRVPSVPDLLSSRPAMFMSAPCRNKMPTTSLLLGGLCVNAIARGWSAAVPFHGWLWPGRK